jgi:hypothetical protein
MTIHVLAYAWRLPALVAADFRTAYGRRAPARAVPGRALRRSLTARAHGVGLVHALAFAHLSSSWRSFR